ncbi:Transposable element Tcb1 transposase [Yarrowia sp. C11]|nr:Transposable element Tcb1 transposase [Yarrowia sp. C11]KAG5363917.1 Transposable element Tcb1 transposase [Yarrowia sp. E02]
MCRRTVNEIAEKLDLAHRPVKTRKSPSGELEIVHQAVKRRLALTEEQAAARLAWCKERAHWSVAKWRKVMWSSECIVERGPARRVWAFCKPQDRYKPENMVPDKRPKGLKVMASAMFWGKKQRSELFIMPTDQTSKRGGVSSKSYKELLDEMLLKYHKPGLIFMQDRNPIHTAQLITKYLAEKQIETMEWPPYSPDLNPIEDAWAVVKKMAAETAPNVWNASGVSEKDKANLIKALSDAWESIPDSTFEDLVKSMPGRLAKCIAAEGYHSA